VEADPQAADRPPWVRRRPVDRPSVGGQRLARRDPGLGRVWRMRDHRITLYPVGRESPVPKSFMHEW